MVHLFVAENSLKNYEQSLSAACVTFAVTYSNYYVENFENIICNYFTYTLKNKYPDVRFSESFDGGNKKRNAYAPGIKATLNSSPFGILPDFRHVLSQYEELIAN
ncbi:hypothetical protein BCV72DRAFT_243891 [Rhizopus microsporus var. microsporus]|uniref:Uncharacterized protein n=2 Tax=Rhizopus microsporus TaxID=58291 RepID=A0A2G4SV50_RHIZD|nr:uncharacterized protein RHIMIDRAFT_251568 [Rhizopus microsporus ATCC 52813]ORE04060.1 hypothetical protein BCV72DRAFT_243891 [Rhizopus microsporus var. microsporus]PHZ12624.1 hypothetical protein RHIMIDRAFT_251568 [Rhizopus microsporus ATCC 52813]